MAAEEVEADEELRELVAQTLETKGVLSKIRAELRAQVFLALEEQDKSQGRQIQGNAKLKSFLSTGDGRLVAGVLREFLEFYGLHYTASVFEPEAGAYELSDRDEIIDKLKMQEGIDVRKEEPILAALVRRSTSEKTQTATISSSKLTSLLSGLGDPPPAHTVADEFPPKVPSTSIGHTQSSSRDTYSGLLMDRSPLSPSAVAENQESKFSPSDFIMPESSKEVDRLSRRDKTQGQPRGLDWTKDISNLHGTESTRQSSLQNAGRQKGGLMSTQHDGSSLNTGAKVSSKEPLLYEEDFVSESIHTESHTKDGSTSRKYVKTPDGITVDETLSQSEVTLGDMDILEPVKTGQLT